MLAPASLHRLRKCDVHARTRLAVVTQPSFYLTPVTLLNLGAGYNWRQCSFSLNIDNALNKEYIGIPTARTNAGLGTPRNIRLTTIFKF